jgi:hypothetical protein
MEHVLLSTSTSPVLRRIQARSTEDPGLPYHGWGRCQVCSGAGLACTAADARVLFSGIGFAAISVTSLVVWSDSELVLLVPCASVWLTVNSVGNHWRSSAASCTYAIAIGQHCYVGHQHESPTPIRASRWDMLDTLLERGPPMMQFGSDSGVQFGVFPCVGFECPRGHWI